MISVTIVSIVGMIRRGGPNGTLFLGPASRNQIAQTMLTKRKAERVFLKASYRCPLLPPCAVRLLAASRPDGRHPLLAIARGLQRGILRALFIASHGAVHRARPRRYAKLLRALRRVKLLILDDLGPEGLARSDSDEAAPASNVKPATCPDTKPAGVRCRPPCDAPLPVAANDVFLWLLGQADGSNIRRLRMLAPATL
jgi:hypothetical protein